MRLFLRRRSAGAAAACVLSLASLPLHAQPCRVLDPGFTEFSGHDCRNGLAHGHGYATGESSYLGDFFEGRRHGNGEAVFRSGARYDGQWAHGRWNGRGKLSFPDGSYYEGEFLNGEKSGRGTYRWPSGTVYEGEWKDNVRLNGVETTATGKTTTYANGAIVTAPPAAPSAQERAQAARQTCSSDADSCETSCSAGTLIGLLITKGKGDAEKTRRDCQAGCDRRKSDCLARIAPPGAPAEVPGGTTSSAIAVAPAGGRKYCSPKNQWCMHDPMADAPPYQELKKACSFFFGSHDPERGNTLEQVFDLDEQLLRRYIGEVPAPGSPRYAWFRDRADVAKCLLESGRSRFMEIVSRGKYFYAANNAEMFFPRSIWDGIIRHTRALHAKNHSTAWFEYGEESERAIEAYRESHRKCGPHSLGNYYPVAWWEANLKALEAIAQRGTAGRNGESMVVPVLRSFRCHQSLGWPYAAENQFWVRYLYEGRTR
jgi:hypothetical protein